MEYRIRWPNKEDVDEEEEEKKEIDPRKGKDTFNFDSRLFVNTLLIVNSELIVKTELFVNSRLLVKILLLVKGELRVNSLLGEIISETGKPQKVVFK